jgi:hypothetical protein
MASAAPTRRGTLALDSPPRGGTRLHIELPCA